MLLSKTIIAVIVAAAAGGIAIGSATTYVIAANKECICKCEETRRGYVPPLSKEAREFMNKPVDIYDKEDRIGTDYKLKKPNG